MKFLLRYKNIDVIQIDLLLYPEGVQVLDFIVQNEDMLPLGLKPFLKGTYDKITQSYLLTEWLMQRSIPDYRRNIDDFVLSVHHLPKHLFGRMNGYQHTAALLSYMSSGFDHYILTPVQREIIYLGKQDGRFINLYNLEPKNDSDKEVYNVTPDINEYIYKDVNIPYNYQSCFPTDSFTIPSELPSWWNIQEQTKVFIQKCESEKDKKRAESLLKILEDFGIFGKRMFDGVCVKTKFSGLENYDVTWLGEFIPYFTQEASVKVQVERRLNNQMQKEVLKKLFIIELKMKEQGYTIGMFELGIACKEENALPIIIL